MSAGRPMGAGRHVAQLVLAVAALAGAVGCWLHVRRWVDVPPITDGQPPTVSVVYDPPLMMLCWLLATAAGVLVVVGVAGLLRRRTATLDTYTP